VLSSAPPPGSSIPMNTIGELPVAVVRHRDESAPSWLLRTAAANELNVSELLRLLGVFNRRDVDVRQSLLWLDVVGPRDCDAFGGVGDPICYLGQTFWPPYLLRLKRPQVCVRCLEESGYCPEIWEFSCYPVCPAHKCSLVDTCASCGRRLRWFRPNLDVCDCGAYVSGRSDDSPNEDAVWIASEISARAGGAPGPQEATDRLATTQLAWWRSVSLSGFMQILVAFGAQTSSKPPTWGSFHRTSTGGWDALVSRGVKRLRALCESTAARAGPEDLRGLIWEGALESLALRPVHAADRDAALGLRQSVFGSAAGARLRRYRKDGRQLELFGEFT
jgi:hypothetical protein